MSEPVTSDAALRALVEQALAQLRHAYVNLHEGRVSRRGMREFADGLIAPQIRKLEAALAVRAPVSPPPELAALLAFVESHLEPRAITADDYTHGWTAALYNVRNKIIELKAAPCLPRPDTGEPMRTIKAKGAPAKKGKCPVRPPLTATTRADGTLISPMAFCAFTKGHRGKHSWELAKEDA